MILLVVRGGPSARLAPRPRRRVGRRSALVFGLVIALFLACVTIGWWYRLAAIASESEARSDAQVRRSRLTRSTDQAIAAISNLNRTIGR